MRIRLLVFTANLCLVCNFILAQLHGTSPNWTTPSVLPKPNNLGDDSKGGVGQNIIQLSTGELIQCFTEKFPFPSGSTKIYFAISSNDGASWSIPAIDTPFISTSVVFGPTIAKDKSDNIHVIWQRNVPSKDIYYAKFDKNFNLLIDTVRVSQFRIHNSLHSAYISVDRSDKVHVMWHDGNSDSTSTNSYFSKTMYRQSPDGGLTWNNQIILSDTTIHKHAAFPRANFSGAPGDTLAIPWRQYVSTTPSNWDVWMAYSVNGGLSWSRSNVANSDSTEWDPGIVVDKNNRIHLHYHEYKKGNLLMSTMEHKYTDNLGTTWSPVATLSPPGIRSQLSVFAYDHSTNTQCICWKDERDFINSQKTRADVMCSFSTNDGVSWIGQEFVNDLDTIPTGFKSVEVGNNNTLYVTFEYADNTGRKSIWFSKRTGTDVSYREQTNFIHNTTIYPNPTNRSISIRSSVKVKKWRVIGLRGDLLLSGTETENISLGELPSGVYFLMIDTFEGQQHEKLIIQK